MPVARKRTPYSKAKAEIRGEFKKEHVTLDRSGRKEFEAIWEQTIGNFFRSYKKVAVTKWHHRKVHLFAVLAVRATARQAIKNANGADKVSATDLRKAAAKVIRQFRKKCPKELGGPKVAAQDMVSALCPKL